MNFLLELSSYSIKLYLQLLFNMCLDIFRFGMLCMKLLEVLGISMMKILKNVLKLVTPRFSDLQF